MIPPSADARSDAKLDSWSCWCSKNLDASATEAGDISGPFSTISGVFSAGWFGPNTNISDMLFDTVDAGLSGPLKGGDVCWLCGPRNGGDGGWEYDTRSIRIFQSVC